MGDPSGCCYFEGARAYPANGARSPASRHHLKHCHAIAYHDRLNHHLHGTEVSPPAYYTKPSNFAESCSGATCNSNSLGCELFDNAMRVKPTSQTSHTFHAVCVESTSSRLGHAGGIPPHVMEHDPFALELLPAATRHYDGAVVAGTWNSHVLGSRHTTTCPRRHSVWGAFTFVLGFLSRQVLPSAPHLPQIDLCE